MCNDVKFFCTLTLITRRPKIKLHWGTVVPETNQDAREPAFRRLRPHKGFFACCPSACLGSILRGPDEPPQARPEAFGIGFSLTISSFRGRGAPHHERHLLSGIATIGKKFARWKQPKPVRARHVWIRPKHIRLDWAFGRADDTCGMIGSSGTERPPMHCQSSSYGTFRCQKPSQLTGNMQSGLSALPRLRLIKRMPI